MLVAEQLLLYSLIGSTFQSLDHTNIYLIKMKNIQATAIWQVVFWIFNKYEPTYFYNKPIR